MKSVFGTVSPRSYVSVPFAISDKNWSTVKDRCQLILMRVWNEGSNPEEEGLDDLLTAQKALDGWFDYVRNASIANGDPEKIPDFFFHNLRSHRGIVYMVDENADLVTFDSEYKYTYG